MKALKQWGRENGAMASFSVSAVIALVVAATCMWGPYAFAGLVGFTVCWVLVHCAMFHTRY